LGHILKLTIEVISWDSSVLGNGFNNVHSIPVRNRIYFLGVKRPDYKPANSKPVSCLD